MSETEKVYTNPPTPFSAPIPGGFSSGKMVRVQGSVPGNGQRFNVNLLCGAHPQTSDIALHVSVRLLEGYIARNTLQSGEWGEEQGAGTLPIAPGQSFEIIVLCGASDYKIAVNGRHFCEFPQRITSDKVSHIGIDGDVTITVIAFEDNNAPPGGPDMRSSQSSNFAGAPSAPTAPYGAPPGAYGPPPGAYGPPPGAYGPPPQQGPYGAPYGAPYGGPPPNAPGAEQESGYGDILDSAQSLIAGAIASGAASKLLDGILGGGGEQSQQHPPAPAPPPQPALPTAQFGGQGSIGGLGSIGSLLTSFAEQALAPQKKDGH